MMDATVRPPFVRYDEAMAKVNSFSDPAREQFVMRGITIMINDYGAGTVAASPVDVLYLVDMLIARGGQPAVADELRGLKENANMGRLVPAGTGLAAFERFDVAFDDRDFPRPPSSTPHEDHFAAVCEESNPLCGSKNGRSSHEGGRFALRVGELMALMPGASARVQKDVASQVAAPSWTSVWLGFG
jgi:hypothetical protein